jgi:glutamate/tyrosine decarboxylase-like PLP-dependent enzyme
VPRYDRKTAELGEAVLAYALRRLQLDPVPLDGPRTREELDRLTAVQISESGIGGPAALDLFAKELAPACISIDNPRYLSFIPCAPTEASSLFDLVVGASALYGGSWLEGAGAVHAENAALRWVAGLAGLPETAGGVFVPGGTVGNLSALVAARHTARLNRKGAPPTRWKVAGTSQTHSSVKSACEVMDVDFVGVPVDDDGRLTGAALRQTIEAAGADGLFAVVATAGTTNFGIVDDLASVAEFCAEQGVWFHVDGAYGGAGLAAPSVRHLFAGIEHADSFTVDPHKWLFAPFDCCALVYREPALAKAAHTQRAGYLDVLTEAAEWNPSDYSVGLTRRARGLPFWFSLVSHGSGKYTEAVERTLSVARHAAHEIRRRSYVELLRDPDLSVVVFRRIGWTPQQYQVWSERLLAANFAFVVPTTHEGETVTRFAVVNPRTTKSDVNAILDTMA